MAQAYAFAGKRRMDQLMSESKRATNRERVLYGLSLDYTIAFVLNLDTDDYEITFSQATNHAQTNELGKFTDYVARYAANFVVPDQRANFNHELNRRTILERFEQADDYHYVFETTPNAAGLAHFQAHIVKEYDDEGRFAFLGFRSIDDILKRERFYQESLEKVNRDLARQLDVITSALPGGVKVSNDDPLYTFKYVSVQFARMLGYDTPAELIEASGGSIVGLAHPDDANTAIANALAQYAKADNYATTYRVRCKDGSWKYIEDRGRKFVTPDGTVEHWNLILDQNELMEKRLAWEREKRHNQARSYFLLRVSHDVPTPLNGIIGLLDICEKHPDDRALVDLSRKKARVAASHLLSLINDTLELSKLQDQDVKLYEETFSVRELQHEIGTISRMRADSEGISIEFKNAGTLAHDHLVGSPLYVKQVLINLITNAVKYNRAGGSVLCLASEQPIDKQHVALRFTISDTGIGMNEEFLGEIYKPFVQADHGARSTYMGTGLGMAIVKNLVDRMGGTIDIRSEEGVGTVVAVSFPFKIAQVADVPSPVCAPDAASLEGARVLLAEDNDLNREIATFILEDAGAQVVCVGDGREAVDVYLAQPEGHFDAVLMDVMMPRMDGYEATRAIRQSGRADSLNLPIIAMTANAFDEDRHRSEAAGMSLHLSKPIDSPALVSAIAGFRQHRSEDR